MVLSRSRRRCFFSVPLLALLLFTCLNLASFGPVKYHELPFSFQRASPSCEEIQPVEASLRQHEIRYDSVSPQNHRAPDQYILNAKLLSEQSQQHFVHLPCPSRSHVLADELCRDATFTGKLFLKTQSHSMEGYHEIWVGYMKELFKHEQKDCYSFINYTTHGWRPAFWGWSEEDGQSAAKMKRLQDGRKWHRYKNLVAWTPFGAPRKYHLPSLDETLSEKNLASAWYLMALEDSTGVRVEDLDAILDFGGGSSSQAQITRRLGFHGTYFIFDLPPVSLLQRFFLRTSGLPAVWIDEYMSNDQGTSTEDVEGLNVLVSRVSTLQRLFPPDGIRLFFATYSLSETPLAKRVEVFPLVSQLDVFFIWFADKPGLLWDHVEGEEQQTSRWGNNLRYFQEFIRKLGDVSFCLWRGGAETSTGSYGFVAMRRQLGRVSCAPSAGCIAERILKCE